MQLNSYQSQVIEDLEVFLRRWTACDDAQLAYRAHWDAQGATRMQGYQSPTHRAPQVCAKVPTAGGKTFIGLHAVSSIFKALQKRQGDARLCLWLVPSLSILQQVLNALRNPNHPYRQSLNRLFEGRVSIMDKRDLLSGQLSRAEVEDGLVLAVLTYDSLKAKNKDDRKLYQENSALDDLSSTAVAVSDGVDPFSLVASMAGLEPVVIVDESHNVTSSLSQDMLRNLNPSFVFELTATPRAGANIISFVDALVMRNQHMVKLPVIVRNLPNRSSVIAHTIDLRARLEAEAQAEEKLGGAYIRPIALIQAESKAKADAQTFEKVKSELIEHGIPEDWIKIKTAEKDELSGIDLDSQSCPVRFVITVNALKEGWDCPFAYILATLADRSSPVDVEQILGRILRQPYVRAHGHEPLNMSYVLTASGVFSQTLEKIVAGLNRAGFSRADFRTPDPIQDEARAESKYPAKAPTSNWEINEPSLLSHKSNTSNQLDLATSNSATTNKEPDFLLSTLSAAEEANKELQAATPADLNDYIPGEVRSVMDLYSIRPEFIDEVSDLRLPQFFRKAPPGLIFADESGDILLEKSQLVDQEFRLADCDINDFTVAPVSGDLVKIDLLRIGESQGDYEPTRVRLKEHEVRKLKDYLSSLDAEAKRRQLTGLVGSWLGKMPPLAESDLQSYIKKILARLSAGQLDEILEQQHSYVEAIKQRVRREILNFSRRKFKHLISLNKLDTKPFYKFPLEISPRQTASVAASNSLYVREEKGNGLEERMSDYLADANNVRWWHRNSSGRGFVINGPINHYPDFIVRLHSGLTIIIETKGSDRDNSDSEAKIELGQLWEKCSGREYRYMMVFEHSPLPGAYSWAEACELIKNL